jgi:hypothetical protein
LALIPPRRTEQQKQGGGLPFVNVFELGGGKFPALALQIGHLAGDELAGAGGLGQFADDFTMRISRPAPAAGGDGESLCQQGVAGQDGDAFAENFVIGRFAAAQIVVVHRRQIVVDEGIGVDALDGASQRHGLLDGAAASLRRRQAERRAEAFAARENGIAHGLVDGGRFGVGRRQQTRKARSTAAVRCGQITLKVKGAGHAGF